MLPSLQELRLAAGRTSAPQKTTGVNLEQIEKNLSKLQHRLPRVDPVEQQAMNEGLEFQKVVKFYLEATRKHNDVLRKLLLDKEEHYSPNVSREDLEKAKLVAKAANEAAQEAMNEAKRAMKIPEGWPDKIRRKVLNGPVYNALNAAKEAVQLADAAMRLVEDVAARLEFSQLIGGPQGLYTILGVAQPEGPARADPRDHAGEQWIDYNDREGKLKSDPDPDDDRGKTYQNELNLLLLMAERYVIKAEDVELYTEDVMQLMRSMNATSEASASSEKSEEDSDESEEDGDESQEDSDESEENGTNSALDGESDEPSVPRSNSKTPLGSRGVTSRASLTPDEQRLKNANMRYRQVRCWLQHLGREGVPLRLGLWLTDDEISTIKTQARLASVQWAREGSDDDHAKAGHAKASPVFWAIMLALQALAVRNESQSVEVKNASFQADGKGEEVYNALTFYTLTGIHEYFDKHLKSTKCDDKAPQDVANTKIGGGKLRTIQRQVVDNWRANVLRLDPLGDDENRRKKAHTLDRLLRRAAAVAEYERTKRSVLLLSAQGAAAGGDAARESGNAAEQLETRAETEAEEAARKAFNIPKNGLFESVRELRDPLEKDGFVPNAEIQAPPRLRPAPLPRKPAQTKPPVAPRSGMEWEERQHLEEEQKRIDNLDKSASDALNKMRKHAADKKTEAQKTLERRNMAEIAEKQKEEDRARKDAAKALQAEEKQRAAIARAATAARKNATQLAQRAATAEKALATLRHAQTLTRLKQNRMGLDIEVQAARRAFNAAQARAIAAVEEAEAKEAEAREAAASTTPAEHPELDGGEE